MLIPEDFNLPSKFTSFRPNQLETAAKIVASDKYAFLVDSPTGTGKSLIAATVQRMLGTSVTYLVTTKQLQDQVLHDFPYSKTIKGRNNYVCLKYASMFPTISAEDCTHTEDKKCELRFKCPYMVAKREALNAPMAILNTAYFLHEANYVGAFSKRGLLICDEFDCIEGQLMGFIEVVITQKQLSWLHVPPPQYKTKFESWIVWAKATLLELKPQLVESEREMDSEWTTIDIKLLRRIRSLKRLVVKLSFLSREVDKNWVWYPGVDRWVFKPTWVAKYATQALWKHADKVLGMSATILDPRQVSNNIGLTLDDRKYDYVALPSLFPKEHRPIYLDYAASVTNKTINVALPRLAKGVEKIMQEHSDSRILVHTVSYKIRDYLLKNIKTTRFITHTTLDRESILQRFKTSSEPLVLLSPSMDRGVDLKDDECRVVIITKMAYPDLSDPQINKRLFGSKDGNAWYAHRTLSNVVQMAGRGVRSEDDYAITYILDEQFKRLCDGNKSIMPAWFREAIVE